MMNFIIHNLYLFTLCSFKYDVMYNCANYYNNVG